MRRVTAVVAVCLGAAGGCRGGAAPEPYAGVLATATPPAPAGAAPVAPPAQPEAIASEVDVPWTIALLSDSDAPTPKPGRRSPLVVVDRRPAKQEPPDGAGDAGDADVTLAVGRHATDEKRGTPRSCSSGVVNRRS